MNETKASRAATFAHAIMARYHQSFGIVVYITVLALVSLATVTISEVAPKAQLEVPV